MKVWKHTAWDMVLLGLSVGQFVTTVLLAVAWQHASVLGRGGGFALLVAMTFYNIVIVSHLFTHRPWFRAVALNRLVAMLNSVNIGQSVQAYHLFHVRNHHHYHNDRKGADGTTRDLSSTFRDGDGDEHADLFWYALAGAARSLGGVGRTVAAATRLWRVDDSETDIRRLAARTRRQKQAGTAAGAVRTSGAMRRPWLVRGDRRQWTILCYLPALYLAFALVNVQNYFEHFGAAPANRYANSVSYYGRLYNLLTFNDGYHQEHHLRPQCHWRALPDLHRELKQELDRAPRVVSPVPALLGFLDRSRRQTPASSRAAAAQRGGHAT